MRFYHVADVHLGASPDQGKPWEKRRQAGIWDSFRHMLNRAAKEHVDAVFICGDLFHRSPLYSELKEVNFLFARIAPVRVFLIAGNHDYITSYSAWTVYPWAENVTVFAQETCSCVYIPEWHTSIYGLSYHWQEQTQPLYDRLSAEALMPDGVKNRPDCCRILLAHGGDEKHIPMNLQRMTEGGFDYIAMGHIHKPWIARNERMAYSGSLEPVDAGDEGRHGYIEGSTNGRQVHVRFIACAQWCYQPLTLQVTPDMSFEEIRAVVSGACRDALAADGEDHAAAKGDTDDADAVKRELLFKLILQGRRSPDLSVDLQELSGLERVHSVSDQTIADIDPGRLREENRGNLLGMFIEQVQGLDETSAVKEKILYEGLRALGQTGER